MNNSEHFLFSLGKIVTLAGNGMNKWNNRLEQSRPFPCGIKDQRWVMKCLRLELREWGSFPRAKGDETGDPSSVSKMQKLEKMIRPAVETRASRELDVNLQKSLGVQQCFLPWHSDIVYFVIMKKIPHSHIKPSECKDDKAHCRASQVHFAEAMSVSISSSLAQSTGKSRQKIETRLVHCKL